MSNARKVAVPRPVGAVSAVVLEAIGTGRSPGAEQRRGVAKRLDDVADPVTDHDLQLALFAAYSLHYGHFAEADARTEWDPQLIAVRSAVEERLLASLDGLAVPEPTAEDVPSRLRELTSRTWGPSISSYLLRRASVEEFRDYVAQRSVYQLMEADPHTWAVPRLVGRAKAALVEIQADEYAAGRPERMHSRMYAAMMRALDLDDRPGAYVEAALPEMLAVTNLMSLFGLHRRWIGALVGQLAAYEMTSTTPSRRCANGLRRLGLGAPATEYYDEHVEADAVHKQLAVVELAGGLVAAEPARTRDVLFGAVASLTVEGRFAAAMAQRWGVGADDAAA